MIEKNNNLPPIAKADNLRHLCEFLFKSDNSCMICNHCNNNTLAFVEMLFFINRKFQKSAVFTEVKVR